ncbi:MAG: hypothetical protein HY816_03520 [Candidatus Wallbacteria bacterium]|nr:hypothetical protein [Candidatus Wallbacteria bacterium]
MAPVTEPGGIGPAGRWPWVAVLAPILALVWLVDAYSVNAPWQDDWELAPLLEKQAEGRLGWSDLYAQHNEHRILFPRLAMLTLAGWTRWNLRSQVWLGLTIAVAGFAVILWLLARTRELTLPELRPWLPVAVAWTWFSAAQYENWLWGWQLQWFLCRLALLVTIGALVSPGPEAGAHPRVRFGIAALAAAIGSFSFGSGLLIWVAGAISLLASSQLRGWLGYWVATGGATWAVYFAGYVAAPGRAPWATALERPGELFLYELACLGSNFSMKVGLAAAAGGAVVAIAALALVRLWRCDRRRLALAAPWVALLVFALLEGGVVAASRLGFGLASATSSRYASISALFTVAAVVLATVALSAESTEQPGPERRRGMAFGALLALLAAGLASGYASGIGEMTQHKRRLMEAVICLSNFEAASDAQLGRFYPDVPKVRRLAHFLRRAGLGGLGR